MPFHRLQVRTHQQPRVQRPLPLPLHVVIRLPSSSSILTIYRPFRQVLGYVHRAHIFLYRSTFLFRLQSKGGSKETRNTIGTLSLLRLHLEGKLTPELYRTQIFLPSSIPTISYFSKSTSATFLLHLIHFHLSRLRSWQSIVRTVQGRPVQPTQGYVHFQSHFFDLVAGPLYLSRDTFMEQEARRYPSGCLIAQNLGLEKGMLTPESL